MVGLWYNTLAMAKDIICTFASSHVGSNRGVARVLGVDKRNIKKGFEKRLLLKTSSQDFWINHRRAKKSNSLAAHFEQVVTNRWTTKTIIYANRRDVIKLKTSLRQFQVHEVHYLQKS